ncbi:MAG: hypothetical protein AAGL98_09555 [Planctomycetota bacterium]
MPRSCGSCTACCSSLIIEELSKPAFTACEHDCSASNCGKSYGGGCAIYEDRPDSCRSFRCLWLDGHLGQDDRPDELGVIFTTTFDEQVGTHPLLVEAVPGRASEPSITAAIQELTKKSPVLVLTTAGGTFHPRTNTLSTTPLTVGGNAA